MPRAIQFQKVPCRELLHPLQFLSCVSPELPGPLEGRCRGLIRLAIELLRPLKS